jgi:hypothetical protein
MKREMRLICPHCGEKKQFKQTAWGTVEYTEYRSIDEFGEVTEIDDSEYDNYQETDADTIECGECETQVVQFDDADFENTYIKFVCEHTNEEGEWEPDGCKLNEELKKQMEAELMVEKIKGEQQ